MILELPVAGRDMEELQDLAQTAAQTAGVLTGQTTETNVRVTFPAAPGEMGD